MSKLQHDAVAFLTTLQTFQDISLSTLRAELSYSSLEEKERLCGNRVISLKSPQSRFLDWSLRFSVVKPVFTAHALFFVGKPKIRTEPLLKNARAGGTRVTLVVRVTFPKFVSFLQNLSLKVGRKTRQ